MSTLSKNKKIQVRRKEKKMFKRTMKIKDMEGGGVSTPFPNLKYFFFFEWGKMQYVLKRKNIYFGRTSFYS